MDNENYSDEEASSFDELTEEEYASTDDDNERSGPIREQDRFLPIANISRIMKKTIPSYAKISRDAKECVQECVSEFISFITSEASDRCLYERRKTINGEDCLIAMANLGFDNYIEPLKIYLMKYRGINIKREKEMKDEFRKTLQSLNINSNFPDDSVDVSSFT